MGRNLQGPWRGSSVTQMVAKIPDPCTFANETGRVNQINMNDDLGTLVGLTSLAHRPLRSAFTGVPLFRSPEVMQPIA